MQARGIQLLEALDADGPEPDERDISVNELHLRRDRAGHGGGTLSARFDDAAMFDQIATVLDAKSTPAGPDDQRTPAQRRADALADACGYVLAHGELPATGGRRPVLNVLIRLEDLEHRARAAMLDFGGRVSPASLRRLACDAAVVPIVLDGAGQPLDVGRATRTVPEGLRRAVTARDRGCARCGRPPSWCEIHHIREWQHGGETSLANCVMLCPPCHRVIHNAGWTVTLTAGRPEFTPPAWIDPVRRARTHPLAALDAMPCPTAPRPHPPAESRPPPRHLTAEELTAHIGADG